MGVAVINPSVTAMYMDRFKQLLFSRGWNGEKNNPGSDLLSRYLAVSVPSALVGLTTEFGMGSGVAPPGKPPGNL